MLADVVTLAPAGGLAALVLALMTLQVRWNNDQRRNEQAMRLEFTTEREALRKACFEDRTQDRIEIAELKSDVARLRERLDQMR